MIMLIVLKVLFGEIMNLMDEGEYRGLFNDSLKEGALSLPL